jgi:hypothetical protein
LITNDENGQAQVSPGILAYLRCGLVDGRWLHGQRLRGCWLHSQWLHDCQWDWEWLLKHAEYQAVALLGEILFCAAVLASGMVQAVCG